MVVFKLCHHSVANLFWLYLFWNLSLRRPSFGYGTAGKCLPSEDGWNEVHGKSPSKHVHHRGRGLLPPRLDMGHCSVHERAINQQALGQDEVWYQP